MTCTILVSMDCISPLNGNLSLNKVGGKAASLNALIQNNLSVPRGFVVSADAFLNADQPLSHQIISGINKAFQDLNVNRVAVRSSALGEDAQNASWAGQLETHLNVTQADLLTAILSCWRSVRSAHAQEYFKLNSIPKSMQSVAVIVQEMVDSDISGVAFTVNPISQDTQEFVVEAIFGLGELLVGAEVIPETVYINRNSGHVNKRESHEQIELLKWGDNSTQRLGLSSHQKANAILKPRHIHTLIGAIKTIDELSNSPQDIEWAFADNKLYILQSRPITTLG